MTNEYIKQLVAATDEALAHAPADQLIAALRVSAHNYARLYVELNPFPESATTDERHMLQIAMEAIAVAESLNTAGQAIIARDRASKIAQKMADAVIARAAAVPGNGTKH